MITYISLITFLVIISGNISDSRICGGENVDNLQGQRGKVVCDDKVFARKCCPLEMAYNTTIKKCVPETSVFDPPVRTQENELLEGFNAMQRFNFIFGKMSCKRKMSERRLPVFPAATNFHLLQDGKLYVEIPENTPNSIIYDPDKYCIDTFVSKDEKPHLNGLICFSSNQGYNTLELSSSCRLVSCFYILLTVAVYAWMPELHNLHGMMLVAYLLSFLMGFLFLSTIQILIMKKTITQNLCIGLTFIGYFSLLSTFFWLNVMCYDTWWTFSVKRSKFWSGTQHMRFLSYAIYAFGGPTALTILLAALEFSDLPLQHALLPKIKLQGCFLYGNSQLLYFCGPTLLLCVANITFIALTASKIAKIKRETEMLQEKEISTNNQDRKDTQRFRLYVKLFVVTGIYWIFEVFISIYPNADFLWQFFDAYNILVGFAIFIIIVSNKKTWKMIKMRYRQMKGVPMSRSTTTISNLTISESVAGDELQLNSLKKIDT